MKRIVLTLIITLSALLTMGNEVQDDKGSFFTATDIYLLDSIHRTSLQLEEAGNFRAAYEAELHYYATYKSLKKQRLTAMIEKQIKESKSNAMDVMNLKLKNQNAQMELEMLENENEMLDVRRAKDSLELMNSRLAQENWANSSELRLKELKKEEEVQSREIAQKRKRIIVLIGVILIAIAIIQVCAIYIKRLAKDYRALEREKRMVDEALKRAQAASSAHDQFIRNLSDDVREPLNALLRAANENAQEGCDAGRRGDNMMKIHINTDRLIKVVDNIIDKVEMSAGNKIMAMALLMSSLTMGLDAQNNPYGLSDEIYNYYLMCERNVQLPEVMAQTDTLIAIARKEKNQQLECLALDVRVGHAYFEDDINKIRAAQNEEISFASTTPYTEYIFYALNRCIIWYLSKLNLVGAERETRHYQEEALRLKNSYGIVKGYYYMGEIYHQRGMDKEAIEQYTNSTKAGNDDKAGISMSYNRIGEIYLSNGEYDKAESALKMAIKSKRRDFELVSPTLQLFRLYVERGDTKNAQRTKATLEEMDRDKQIYAKRREIYISTLVKYYMLIGDEDKVKENIGLISESEFETGAEVYAMMGDYQKAFVTLHNGIDRMKEEEQTIGLARLLALQNDYEYSVSEIQNNKLALQNTMLRVEHMKRRNELNKERLMQDSALLSNSKLQRESATTADNLMAADHDIMVEELTRKDVEIKSKRNIARISSAIVVILMIFTIMDAIRRRYMTHKLEREKRQTEEVCRLAEEATERKRQFLEQVTHEIRTPLNVVLGYNQILCDEKISESLSEEDRIALSAQSNMGAESLNRMVGIALDVCNIDSGNMEKEMSQCDVNTICRSLVERYSAKVPEGVTISCEGDDVATLTTDGAKVERILSLLLDDACKFTKSGSIRLERKSDGELVELSVTDTGCGIAKSHAEDVFKNFFKVDSFVPGIGLGLPLCRSLAHMIGGEVKLDTSYIGGSRFILQLVE